MAATSSSIVVAGPAEGRVPAIPVLRSYTKTWMAVTSTAMTIGKSGANHLFAYRVLALGTHAFDVIAPFDCAPCGRALRVRRSEAIFIRYRAYAAEDCRGALAGASQ